jgi:CRP-like cAMP-binding protein
MFPCEIPPEKAWMFPGNAVFVPQRTDHAHFLTETALRDCLGTFLVPFAGVIRAADEQDDSVSAVFPSRVSNRLLSALPLKERNRMLEHCDLVDLAVGEILCEAGQPLSNTYFPLTSFIALTSSVTGRPGLGAILVGNEGMLGATLALGLNKAIMPATVQGGGTAWRMSAIQLCREIKRTPAFLEILNHYLYGLMAQLSRMLACTAFHEVEPRLARCLLMTHDRAHADHFHLTHQLLADMIGVQRSAVTIAAGALQKKGLISYSRGGIHILSRKGLESASCDCYASMRRDSQSPDDPNSPRQKKAR